MRMRSPRAFAQVVSPSDRRWVTELVARWQSRQISNFEYLMRLNTLAGGAC